MGSHDPGLEPTDSLTSTYRCSCRAFVKLPFEGSNFRSKPFEPSFIILLFSQPSLRLHVASCVDSLAWFQTHTRSLFCLDQSLFLRALLALWKGRLPCGHLPPKTKENRTKDQAEREISATELNMLPCLYPWSINVVVYHDPSGRSHLGRGLALRCFQRLSFPDVATQQCR